MLREADSDYLESLQKQAILDNKEIVVSAVIINNDQVFVQKRSASRKLFPNCWDVVGGHVEANEDIYSALKREIKEETGWRIDFIAGHFNSFDWYADDKAKREFAFLVIVRGNLDKPKLEKDKHSSFLWLDEADVEILKDKPDDLYIYNLVKKAFNELPS